MRKFAIAFAGLAAASAAQAVTFTVSLESEAAGIQDSRSGFFSMGVETFDGRTTGTGQGFTTSFGGSAFTGVYAGVQVNGADQYGGAQGSGNYAVTFGNPGYTLDLSTSLPGGVTYFGFWLSALDGGNNVSFYQGGQRLFTFTASEARNFINGLPNSSTYFCNPNGAFAGQNCGEPYAFLNFYARRGTRFDRIEFNQVSGGGYESDNHTVGQWRTISGTVIPVPGSETSVPEPSAWALLIAGFGLVGTTARRRRTRIVAA